MALNAFIFPWGILTPSLLDVAALLGLPGGGHDVHADSAIVGEEPSFISSLAFSNHLARNAKSGSPITEGEHYAFMLYFFNRYFYCPNSFAIV